MLHRIALHDGVKPEVIARLSSEEELEAFLDRMARHEVVPFERSGFITGEATAILRRAREGDILVHSRRNLIVNGGKDLVFDCLLKSASRPAVANYIAIGTGATAAAAGQTALVTENARAAATYAHTAGTATATMGVTFAAGTGTGAIVEAGLLNAASAGTMLNRVVFSVINKAAGDALTQNFTFTLS